MFKNISFGIFCLILTQVYFPVFAQDSSTQEIVVTGINIHGEESSCRPMDGPVACSMEIRIGDLYAFECRQKGFKAVQCACHEFLCVEYETKLVNGIDMYGEQRSCFQMSPKMKCPEIFTEGDEYAQKCVEQGNYAVACDCHDYICVMAK